MKLHPLIEGFMLEGFPSDPVLATQLLFQNMHFESMHKELCGMLLAASLPSQKYWKTYDQSDYVWNVNQLKSLVAVGFLLYKKKLWKSPILNAAAEDGSQLPFIPNELIFLTSKEVSNPYTVFKQVFKNISLDQWLDFLDNCIANAISNKYEPYWTEDENQLPCGLYLFKMLEAAYLIYCRERNGDKIKT